ncbi:hypothetical protein ABPG72_003244 [Tetrahymena utriculariae]
MYLVAYVELGCLCIFTLWFIQHHSNKEVSLFVKLVVFIDWFLSFGQILLLPVDVYLKIYSQQNNISQEGIPEFFTLKLVHGIFFWLVMLLCWIIIPLMEDYQECGYLDHERKWQYTLKKNTQFFGIVGGLTIISVVILESTDMMNGYGLITFLKSLANCWGIFQIMILLGYSLVTVPRSHFRTINDKLQMKYLCFRAAQIKKEQEDSFLELISNLKDVLEIKRIEKSSKDILFYCDNIIHLVPAKIIKLAQQEPDIEDKDSQRSYSQKKNIHYTFDSVVELRKQVQHNWSEFKRSGSNWKSLLKKAFWLQDIIKNQDNESKKVIESSLRKPRTGFQADLRNKIEWYWYMSTKKQIKAIWSIFLTAMSIIVLLSEISLFWDKDLSILGWFVQALLSFELSVFWVQIVTLIPLLFMIFNVYYGLFRLKISGFFGLYPNGHTDAASLLFASVNFSRVAAPLCYNYLEMINITDTAFNKVLGNINIVPVLGSDFTNFFPSLLVLFCLFNLFDLYGKVLSLFGLESFQFTDTYNSSLIEEGQDLIKKARIKEEEKLEDPSKKEIQLQDVDNKSEEIPTQKIENKKIDVEDRQTYLEKLLEEEDL